MLQVVPGRRRVAGGWAVEGVVLGDDVSGAQRGRRVVHGNRTTPARGRVAHQPHTQTSLATRAIQGLIQRNFHREWIERLESAGITTAQLTKTGTFHSIERGVSTLGVSI